RSSAAPSIQPGFYRLRKHMAAGQALALLLQPSARVSTSVTIPEGLIEQDILAKLAKTLKVSSATMQKAAADVSDLGLPQGYTAGSTPPKSAEGFLFPDTYSFDPGTSPAEALQQMTSEFTGIDRDTGFAEAAQQPGQGRVERSGDTGPGHLAVLRQRRRRRAPVLHGQPERVPDRGREVPAERLGLHLGRKAAVLGRPIAHSLSPVLPGAA